MRIEKEHVAVVLAYMAGIAGGLALLMGLVVELEWLQNTFRGWSLAMVVVALAALSTVYVWRRTEPWEEWWGGGRLRGLASVLCLVAMFMILTGANHLVWVGPPVDEEFTVVSKARNRSGSLPANWLLHMTSDEKQGSIAVHPEVWDRVEVGTRVRLRVRRGLWGFWVAGAPSAEGICTPASPPALADRFLSRPCVCISEVAVRHGSAQRITNGWRLRGLRPLRRNPAQAC